ncbi:MULTISPECIES: hypothetical protein [unclassified Nonomuraea]|uniref:hypothetical protein n=1 Tax=unclassified Nonomuraea TaxID=2593643 RepID=UPI0033F4584F
MAFGDPYITRDELKSWLKIPLADTLDDMELDAALAGATSSIDMATERTFNRDTTASPSATARTFRPMMRGLALVDDFYSTAGLIIRTEGGATTWAADDYLLEPRNGVYRGSPGWPYWKVRSLARDLDVGSYDLEVTALWGWAEVPAGIKQATRLLAADLFKLKDAPLGVAGFGELGLVRVRENSTVASLIRPYRKNPVKVR